MLAKLSHVAKGFGPTLVLRDVSFVINETDRLALVGANGVGKSTLLQLLAGHLAPDGGEVVIPRPITIAYLPQAIHAPADQTVDDLVQQSLAEVQDVGRKMQALEAALGSAPSDTAESLLATYSELEEQFERLGGYTQDHRIDAVFTGLGIDHLQRGRALATLSGGEKARVALAALLLRPADLLLLDEPTNHLDFATLAWLEEYLRRRRGAYLVVSHDRQFINCTASAIVEIDDYLRDAQVFPGNYDAYLAAKQREQAQWRELYEREQEERRRLQAIVDGAARRVGHSNRPPPDKDKYAKQFFGENVQRAISRNARAAQEKLRRIEANPILRPPDPLRLRTPFDPETLAGRLPLVASGLTKTYGERRLLDGVDLVVSVHSRVVVTGPNGAGKSTLLRLLAGLVRPDSGTVTRAPSVVVGYLDQEQAELDPEQLVFDAYRTGLSGDEDALRADLFRFGFFRYEDLAKRVGQLSVGQRRKLQLARLVATRANLLLLDEPTNHLDLPTLEAFEAALLEFPGPVVAATHDRWFISRFSAVARIAARGGPPAETWELRGGRLQVMQTASTAPQRAGGQPARSTTSSGSG